MKNNFELIMNRISFTNPKISFFKNGDFGDLSRIEFEWRNIGGTIDVWSEGWLNIHLIDYHTDKEIINKLLEPNEKMEQAKLINELIVYLNPNSFRREE